MPIGKKINMENSNNRYKFRVWDKENKKMWVSHKKISKYLICGNKQTDISTFFDDDNYILMQFTGLHDKNGKEIYEKDIVKGRFNLDDVEDYIYLSLTEKEKKEQEKLFIIEDIFYPHTNPIPEDLEVIGNTYENSHLLDNK